MAITYHNLTLEVTPRSVPPVLHVSEYDINRQIDIRLTQDGQPFEIPTGTTAKIEGSIGDHGFSHDATVNGSVISFVLQEAMTAVAGRVWTKVKLTKDGFSVSTAAFILAVDRAGVEADTVIGATGFEQQIVDAVNDWLDAHPPATGGMTEEIEQALLDCFENVAWINDDGQTYYGALYDALYPPVDVLSISAVFTQGEAVIYDTDSLDDLKQYLVVTATMTDSTTQTVTTYTLSGTLSVGTSTITVSYGGKTDTFTVTVTEASLLPSEYQQVEWVQLNAGYAQSAFILDDESEIRIEFAGVGTQQQNNFCGANATGASSGAANVIGIISYTSAAKIGAFFMGQSVQAISYDTNFHTYVLNKDGLNVDGTDYAFSDTPSAGTISNNPFLLGKITRDNKTASSNSCIKIKNVSVKSSSGNGKLIPCYRKSDGVIGFYDTLSEVLRTDAGSATSRFTKGSDVA